MIYYIHSRHIRAEYFPAGAELPSSVPNTYDSVLAFPHLNDQVHYSKLRDVLDHSQERRSSATNHNSDGIYEKLSNGEVDSSEDVISDTGSMDDNPMYGELKT